MEPTTRRFLRALCERVRGEAYLHTKVDEITAGLATPAHRVEHVVTNLAQVGLIGASADGEVWLTNHGAIYCNRVASWTK
ncbi:MAG: hypothetical protein LC793_12455 [Thermomicrobia bacterium]|nr:hypothetical protein [Thermomicrobia bacterium]